MSTLQRYLLREVAGPFGAWLAFLFALFFGMALFRGSESLLGAAVSGPDLARVLTYLAPHFFVQAAPIALLLSLLVGLGRMAEDGELAALRSLGVRPSWLLGGPLVMGLLVSLALLAVMLTVHPWGMRSVRALGNEIAGRNLVSEVRARRFYEELPGMVLYAQDVRPGGSWGRVLVEDTRDASAPTLLLADSARVRPVPQSESIEFLLGAGELHRAAGADGAYARLGFEQGELQVRVFDAYYARNKLRVINEEMSPLELYDAAEQTRGRGERATSWEVALHWKLAQAAAPLAFAVAGTPLSMSRRRGGRARALALTLLAYVAWYVLARAGVSLGEKGTLAPLWAGVLPNAAFVVAGLLALRWLDTRGRP